ncbi:MAG TPA: DUF983 domain-containing protein [Chitinophagales bacterium]|nr:DUF983 domain-containing protein [Chitinophagales bacterium]
MMDRKKLRAKRNIFKVLFQARCTRCGQGEMFKDPNPYRIKNFDKMNRYCSNCNMDFEPEVGFYFGAMYFSYAFGVAFSVFTFVLHLVFFGLDANIYKYLILNTAFLVVLWPFIFRISRVMYLWFTDVMFGNEETNIK